MRPLFTQERVAASAGLFLDGLLGSACSRPMSRGTTPKKQPADDPQEPPLIRWSVQEIRRVVTRLAQRRIEPAAVIAWSLWRRAHQGCALFSLLGSRHSLFGAAISLFRAPGN